MSSTNNNFDDVLFEVLKESKTIPGFFDAIFGFLSRKSDFFVVAKDKCSPVGLTEGTALGLVTQTFHKWSTIHRMGPPVTTTQRPKPPERTVPRPDFTSSESYNGAKFDTYSWSQTINELDVIVRVPEGCTKKDLRIVIEPQHICVETNGGAKLVDGELCRKVKHNDAIWSMDRGRLEVHLEKSAEVWWDCLVTTEPRLDVTKIDCSRPYEELSEEAQAKIEELTWNQERKRLGLPTFEQIDLEGKLKRAWNAEGSPFSGPFDPSSVTLG